MCPHAQRTSVREVRFVYNRYIEMWRCGNASYTLFCFVLILFAFHLSNYCQVCQECRSARASPPLHIFAIINHAAWSLCAKRCKCKRKDDDNMQGQDEYKGKGQGKGEDDSDAEARAAIRAEADAMPESNLDALLLEARTRHCQRRIQQWIQQHACHH